MHISSLSFLSDSCPLASDKGQMTKDSAVARTTTFGAKEKRALALGERMAKLPTDFPTAEKLTIANIQPKPSGFRPKIQKENAHIQWLFSPGRTASA